MTYYEQSVIDRSDPAGAVPAAIDRSPADMPLAPSTREDRRQAERAARASLRAQISRMERELSGIVAGRFPFIAAPVTPIRRGAAVLRCSISVSSSAPVTGSPPACRRCGRGWRSGSSTSAVRASS